MARSTELSRWLAVPRRHHYGVGEETLLLSWFMSSSGLQLLGALYHSIASDLPTGQAKIACYVLLRRYPHQTHPYWPKSEDEEASHC